MKGRLSTLKEAVTALKLPSSRTLHRMIERGAPGPKPGKRGGRRYDVSAIEAWRAARETKARPTLDLSAERARLARVQRKLTTLRLLEARRTLVRVKDVERIQLEIAGAVKTQLLAVSRRAVLAGLPVEHEPLIHRLIVEALRELSEARTLADLDAAKDEDPAA